MNHKIWRTAARSLILVCLPLGLAVCNGCSDQTSALKMVSNDGKHDFDQKFGEAYISKSETGDTDVILISQAEPAKGQDPTKPLRPLASALTPRQIVHIRIYWKPLIGIKADHPANTNASIHWYMLADTAPQADYVEYSGSGLVDVDDSDTGASLIVHRAWMKPANHRGVMVDPLGPSELNGKIEAKIDPDEVKTVLAEVKAAATPVAAEARAGQTGKEPARLSVGP